MTDVNDTTAPFNVVMQGRIVYLCTACLKGYMATPDEKCPNPNCGHQAKPEKPNGSFVITSISESTAEIVGTPTPPVDEVIE